MFFCMTQSKNKFSVIQILFGLCSIKIHQYDVTTDVIATCRLDLVLINTQLNSCLYSLTHVSTITLSCFKLRSILLDCEEVRFKSPYVTGPIKTYLNRLRN